MSINPEKQDAPGAGGATAGGEETDTPTRSSFMSDHTRTNTLHLEAAVTLLMALFHRLDVDVLASDMKELLDLARQPFHTAADRELALTVSLMALDIDRRMVELGLDPNEWDGLATDACAYREREIFGRSLRSRHSQRSTDRTAGRRGGTRPKRIPRHCRSDRQRRLDGYPGHVGPCRRRPDRVRVSDRPVSICGTGRDTTGERTRPLRSPLGRLPAGESR